MLEQPISRFTGDPGDLVDMVDVRMQADLFGHVATLVGKLNERVGP